MKDLIKSGREELPNTGLKILSDVIGIGHVKEIMVKLPGHTFHVPKRVHREIDDEYIRKNFRDFSVEQLAIKLGLSERTIFRRIKALALHQD